MINNTALNSIAKRYAEKFTEEYPCKNILERPKSFTSPNLPGHTFMNGESFAGPYQTWPAQLVGLSHTVSKEHKHREMSYESLRGILLLEEPELLIRDYKSEEEYAYTIARIFQTTLATLYSEKLKRVTDREVQKRKDSSVLMKLILTSNKRFLEKTLEQPEIKGRVDFISNGKPVY
jgi:hypothetical protein